MEHINGRITNNVISADFIKEQQKRIAELEAQTASLSAQLEEAKEETSAAYAEFFDMVGGKTTSLALGEEYPYSVVAPYLLYHNEAIESVALPSHVNEVKAYFCAGASALTSLFAPGANFFGAHAFDGCVKLADIQIGPVAVADEFAFASIGNQAQLLTPLDISFSNNAPIGEGAFSSCALLRTINGNAGVVGNNAFYACANLEAIDLANCSSIGENAFKDCRKVSHIDISAADIASIGVSAFYRLGVDRANEEETMVFDFRNSSFSSVPNDLFGGSSSARQTNFIIYLPPTVVSINSYFSYMADSKILVYGTPTLSSSSALMGSINTYFIVEAENYDTLISMSNWSSIAAYVLSGGSGYHIGEKLPPYSRVSGRRITWYKEPEHITEVEVSEGENYVYYSTIGEEREVWSLDETMFIDGSFQAIDQAGNVYDPGDFVPIGSAITITPKITKPNKSILVLFSVNGVDCTEAKSVTLTPDSNIGVTVIYWDGVHTPFLPNLADNTWEMIKLASKKHDKILDFWNVGDIKDVIINGLTYQVRLVDKTGKYKRAADGSTAWLKFEFAQLLMYPTPFSGGGKHYPWTTKFNDSVDGTGDDNTMSENITVLKRLNQGDMWNAMPIDLRSALEDVQVAVSSRGGAKDNIPLTQLSLKLFLQREGDMYHCYIRDTKTTFAELYAGIDLDEYYKIHSSNYDRAKRGVDDFYAYPWAYYLLSPANESSEKVCGVDGGVGGEGLERTLIGTTGGWSLAPVFAL